MIGLLVNPNNPASADPRQRRAGRRPARLGWVCVQNASSDRDIDAAFATMRPTAGRRAHRSPPMRSSTTGPRPTQRAGGAPRSSYDVLWSREFADAGGLMSYGATLPMRIARPASMPAGFSRARSPLDLPVQQPTKVRAGDQPQDRQGARPRHPADAARPRRRGDRMMRRASSSCGSVRIDGARSLAGPDRKGTSDCADEVTLSRKGAKGRTHGRKLRSH